jgi:PAS domain S-box-containing protein
VVSWFTPPFNATYAASKHAALAVSDAARIELRKQGTQVVGVYAGFIDTEMAVAASGPRMAPAQVAERTLEGVESGLNHILVDERARQIYDAVRRDPEQLERTQQEAWDQLTSTTTLPNGPRSRWSRASGSASKLYLASMIGESRWFSTNASISSISPREPWLTPWIREVLTITLGIEIVVVGRSMIPIKAICPPHAAAWMDRDTASVTEITKSEVRLRTIIDTIPVMAWCALPDGFAEFHNQRWLDYTGLSDKEGRGWGWRTAIHPEDSQAAVDEWRDIIASKKSGEGERLVRRFDGEYRRHMYRAQPLMDERGTSFDGTAPSPI